MRARASRAGSSCRGSSTSSSPEKTSDGRFRYRVDFDWDELEVVGDTASVLVTVLFERLRGESWETRWKARIEAELRDGDEGWEITRTRHETLEGRGF